MTDTDTKTASPAWTAGPWNAAAKPSSIVGMPVVSNRGRPVADVVFFHLGDAFSVHDRESAANARLIAAAPDLYEALAGLLDYDEQDEDCAATTAHIAARDAARAALAKASTP